MPPKSPRQQGFKKNNFCKGKKHFQYKYFQFKIQIITVHDEQKRTGQTGTTHSCLRLSRLWGKPAILLLLLEQQSGVAKEENQQEERQQSSISGFFF